MAQTCSHCGGTHEAFRSACPVTGERLRASFTLAVEDEMLIGTLVADRYRVDEVVGVGTSATVFGATVAHVGRPVVLKVLRPRHVSLEDALRAIEKDARPAWAVTHASLGEVTDLGELPDGAPLIAMERLEGETLASRIGAGRLSLNAAVDVTMQLLAALDALHTRGVLVRDLRPQNVFLAERRGCRPLVKLLDVGLGGLVPLPALEDEWESRRKAGTLGRETGALAAPYYLSPEQARGDASLGPASDVFSAAVVLYEALSGERPFTAPSLHELLLAITVGGARPVSAHRGDVPGPLDALLTRALSPHSRERPATAAQFQDELRAAFENGRTRQSIVVAPLARKVALGARAAIPSLEALYEEETRTDQKVDVRIDEASAESPHRTVPPPPTGAGMACIDIEVDDAFDPPASVLVADGERSTARSPEASAPSDIPNVSRDMTEDEETETMRQTPEVRERLKQMQQAALAAAAAATTDESVPPTRKLSKPPHA